MIYYNIRSIYGQRITSKTTQVSNNCNFSTNNETPHSTRGPCGLHVSPVFPRNIKTTRTDDYNNSTSSLALPHPDASSLTADHDVEKFVPTTHLRRQTKHTPGKSKDGKSAAENQKKKDSYPPGSGEKGEYHHEIGGGGGWFKSRVRRQTKHVKGPSRGTKPAVDKQKESDEHGNMKGLLGPICPACPWYKKQSDQTGNLPGERGSP